MIKILLPVFLVFSACSPLEDVREDCQEVAGQALDECIAFYEDVAIPEIRAQLQNTLEAIQNWFDEQIAQLKAELEQALTDKKIEILTELGCTKDPSNSFGWDCTNTVVCD